jgi:uncharacterized protein (DUF849 family)
VSRFEDPVILSCSISGAIANREQCPAIPYTPGDYAEEARRAVEEAAGLYELKGSPVAAERARSLLAAR